MKGITQEEVSKLTRAMKDKQFQSHMDEYCKEISDRAHRKEYLQYLDQLEAKGEMPEGQVLLRTEPGCCVKTMISFKSGQTQKCFINIVHSDLLQDMSEVQENGGKRMHLPYSLGPPRPERDNKDQNCMTCDFAVSTWTFGQAIQRPQVLKAIVDTAADGLSQQFLKGHEEVKKDWKLLRKVQCKGPGGVPLPMSVKGDILRNRGKHNRPSYRPQKDVVTPSELRQMRVEAKEEEERRRKGQAQEADEDAEEEVVQQERPSAEASVTESTRIRVPSHKLVHSGTYNLTDFMEATHSLTVQAATVPRLLKLVVELPTVKKSGDISLDVTNDNVVVEVDGKFYLDLPLPYEIESENGQAKFDKVKQVLSLDLPVKPKLPDPNRAATFGSVAETSMPKEEGEEAELDGIDDEPEDGLDEEPQASQEGSRALSESPNLELHSAVPEHEEAASPVTLGAENYAEGGAVSSTAGVKPTSATSARGTDMGAPLAEEELPPFEPATAFAGRRPGYAFKLGEQGLGYYRDSRQPRPHRDPTVQAEAAGAAGEGGTDEPGESAPLVEVVSESVEDYVPASASSSSPASRTAKRVASPRPLPQAAVQYLEAISQLTSPLASSEPAGDPLPTDEHPQLSCHQTRQNLVLLVGITSEQKVAAVTVSLASRRFALFFHLRSSAAAPWRRCCLQRALCRAIDPRQWHVEASPDGSGQLLVVLRKVDAGDLWPEVFDESASAELPAAGLLLAEEEAESQQLGAEAGQQKAVVEVDAGAPAAADVASAVTTAAATSAAADVAAKSAALMGMGVILRNRLMYQLL